MEIIYSDHTRDLTIFYNIVAQDKTYKVQKSNINDNFLEIVLEDTLENCINYITNKITE
jgi:hypothetical protein